MADTTKSPLVSIIMPAYNAARFIAQSIRSVQAQTYPHWELIIIDDASADDTGAIVQQFKDERIRYHRVNRIGSPSGVRNTGLKLARGEYIAFLDADDVYYPQALATLLEPLLENPRLTAAYGFSYVIDENGNPLRQPMPLISLPQGGYALPERYRVTWPNIVTGNISCLLPGLMLRKSTLDRVGLFNELLCGPEDYEFYVRLYLDNFEGVVCLPHYIYQYRLYGESLTKDPARYEKVLNSVLRVMTWLFYEAPLPENLKHLESGAVANAYRYLARERLLHGQPELARKIAMQALSNTSIKRMDWVRLCLPLVLRSILPNNLNQWLVSARFTVRNHIDTLKQYFVLVKRFEERCL